MKVSTRGKALFLFVCSVASSFNYAFAQEETPVADEDIKVVHFEEMNYPTFARAARIEGVVVVRVRMDDQGNVLNATAISGKKPLIPDCLANARKWKFQPNARKMAVIVYHFVIPTVVCGSVTSFFTLQAPNLATVTTCPLTVEITAPAA